MAKQSNSRSRLSNTAAVRSGFGGDFPFQHSSRTRSVRRIENGYVTCESESGPAGYTSREVFSATPPSGDGAGDVAPRDATLHGPNETRGSLAEATRYLKGGK